MPVVEGVHHSFHRVGDVELHLAEAGQGPPLLLLHGWWEHWYTWRKLIPALSRDYRVLCPDLRGFGWSEAPAKGYDRETMARDILGLLDELGIERVRVAGHDWGGWLGFLLCLMAPERVERFMALGIANPSAPLSAASVANYWRFWYQWVLAAPLLGAAAVRRLSQQRGLILRWAAGPPETRDERTLQIFLAQLEEPERVRASVLLYRAFLLRDMRRMLLGRYRRRRPRVPTLLLHGAGDKIIRPSNLPHPKAWAEDLEIELIPDCGHFIVDERPGLVLERAFDFFGRRARTTEEAAPIRGRSPASS
jgi:pimeloyl-ACP methyl ester carboxylesterase